MQLGRLPDRRQFRLGHVQPAADCLRQVRDVRQVMCERRVPLLEHADEHVDALAVGAGMVPLLIGVHPVVCDPESLGQILGL